MVGQGLPGLLGPRLPPGQLLRQPPIIIIIIMITIIIIIIIIKGFGSITLSLDALTMLKLQCIT